MIRIIPYLKFQGNCEEALLTYQKIFDAEVGRINRYDNPAMPVPAWYANKIMHAELTFGDNVIMFADLMPGTNVTQGNGYSISIAIADIERAREIFVGLANQGNITVPFEKQFWGSWFGEIVDQFGIDWMIMCETGS